ncbi:exodeoxyribonuclease 7 large subunit [Methanobrevibacter oralis]|uniref:Exodeoxyribonuclease 7 large subunit n=1 Tax=Methanobrevibacter oralis TaxID=66851 RepID=A0A166BME9_METOA|nr:exodeoxyribonuclease VII large subunit [Methanobrevibacter oralis]KZX13553.1 exodeoxyribonuclease 7 large subunit [Methanobrevibacter oralis]
MNEDYMTVSQLTKKIKRRIDTDFQLKNIYIKGEISNFKINKRSKHGYFTLKDKNTQIKGIIFSRVLKTLKFQLKDGMHVLIKGSVEIYEAYGQYQLQVNKVTEDGIGDLYIAYKQLKEKLNNEGLFDNEKKKNIPKFPKRIGVITTPTGAAIRDIITTIHRRHPICEILIFPSLVQGDIASFNIIKQIKASEKYNLDTLIIGRGGGSIEDLNAFNDENVARAVYNCKTPVISAVGHEIDYTIIDFVADLRAPTPTAAAELAVSDLKSIENEVNHYSLRSKRAIATQILKQKENVNNICKNPILKNPYKLVNTHEITLDNLVNRLNHFTINIAKDKANKFNQLKIHLNYVQKEYLDNKKHDLKKIKENYTLKNPKIITQKKNNRFFKNIEKLEILNPLLTLKRGYTLTKIKGKIISTSKDVKKGEELEIEFKDGNVNTKVI